MKKQNADINILKFLFSLSIVLLHIDTQFGFPEWQGCWIAVEWFFVFAGYTMTAHIYQTKPFASCGTETVAYVLRRAGTFFPYLIPAAFIALAERMAAGHVTVKCLKDVTTLLQDPLLLQIFGLQGTWYIGITWFLSALLAAVALFYPVLRKYKGTFDRVYALLIPLFIYGWIDSSYGYLWMPGEWLGFVKKGFLRAVCGICIGMVSYNIGLYLKKRWKPGKAWEAASLVIYLMIFVIMYKWDDSKIYYLIPFVFAFLIAVSMTASETVFEDSALTRFLGKISMVIYITHCSWVFAMERWFTGSPRWEIYLVAFGGTALASVIVYFAGARLKTFWNWLFKGIGEQGERT